MGAEARPRLDEPLYGAGVSEAFGRYWLKAFTFTGRASRSEYWTMWLMGAVLGVAGWSVGYAAGASGLRLGGLMAAATLLSLAALVPGLSLAVRRLHDTNRSGWWLLFGLIPFGALFVLLAMAASSDPAGARFDPAAARMSAEPAGPPPILHVQREPAGGSPARSSERSVTLVLASVMGGGLLVVAISLLVWAGSMNERSAAVVPTVQGAAPARQTSPTAVRQTPAVQAPTADAREAALRQEVESAAGWQKYSRTLYFKWENGMSVCQTVGVSCQTVRIENVAATDCSLGSVELTLLSNGTPVASSSGDFYLLRQGQPVDVGVPFNPNLKGDQVRLDRITCS
ncbi:hypothetical protein GCM10027449_26390 [Sinomonas notoginsengisoli]|uniref:DUF805 domain-containing protein n=1 Tax=Sinomonas notoginsengisoli TaxID=1457311 RepID=UPI001F48A47D|nr:DUF805 domain-containing protein [Sinomonas notoginsengisoli]